MISLNEAKLKLHSAVLNGNSGSISKDSVSYKYDYLVITDHDVSSEEIYAYGRTVLKLPMVGDRSPYSNRQVASVSIDRWDEANMSAVPTYNLPKKDTGAYAAWKYEITCDKNSSSSSSGESRSVGAVGGLGGKRKDKPETVKEAIKMAKERLACGFSQSVKTYTKQTSEVYQYQFNKDSPVGDGTNRVLLKSPSGSLITLEREDHNRVFTFTYYSTDIDIIPDHCVFTTNSKDIEVCGRTIYEGTGLITNFTSQLIYEDVYDEHGEFKEQRKVLEHQVEIETYTTSLTLIHTDTSARLDLGDGKGLQYYPICELIHGSSVFKLLYEGTAYDKYFFDKERLLGAFSALEVEVTDAAGRKVQYRLQAGIDYNYISEPKVLDKNGQYYKGTAVNVDDPNVGKIIVYPYPKSDWSSLHLPYSIPTVYSSDTYEPKTKATSII